MYSKYSDPVLAAIERAVQLRNEGSSDFRKALDVLLRNVAQSISCEIMRTHGNTPWKRDQVADRASLSSVLTQANTLANLIAIP